jgi:hypothetical protein
MMTTFYCDCGCGCKFNGHVCECGCIENAENYCDAMHALDNDNTMEEEINLQAMADQFYSSFAVKMWNELLEQRNKLLEFLEDEDNVDKFYGILDDEEFRIYEEAEEKAEAQEKAKAEAKAEAEAEAKAAEKAAEKAEAEAERVIDLRNCIHTHIGVKPRMYRDQIRSYLNAPMSELIIPELKDVYPHENTAKLRQLSHLVGGDIENIRLKCITLKDGVEAIVVCDRDIMRMHNNLYIAVWVLSMTHAVSIASWCSFQPCHDNCDIMYHKRDDGTLKYGGSVELTSRDEKLCYRNETPAERDLRIVTMRQEQKDKKAANQQRNKYKQLQKQRKQRQ